MKHSPRTSQSGAALAIGLVLLSVLTVLALTASRSARLQDRVSRAVRDADLSLQLAESGLRSAERHIDSLPAPDCTNSPCRIFSVDAVPDLDSQTTSWWSDPSNKFVSTEKQQANFGGKKEDEVIEAGHRYRYIIEELAFVEDELTIGDGIPSGRSFYRISGQSQVRSQHSVVQTTYARRY